MTEAVAPEGGAPPEGPTTFTGRLTLLQRAGGLVTPLLTALLAFLVGGLVVLVFTGNNPLGTYKEIFNGSGLNWLLPGQTCSFPCPAALGLQQTLIQMTPLLLTGIAVAFAFRGGLFNIGGQGQYIVGTVAAVQTGIWFESWPALPHVIVAVGAAMLAGAFWAGIAGFLRATVGAHEVITTIMLNWIALWIASYLVGFGGPLQDPGAGPVPVTREIAESAKLHVFWGSPVLQGLHIGLFIAFAALVVYWILLNRTTLGYEVRAVGFNPEAAAYSGISVRRTYVTTMAVSGAFAGTGGAMDILGWQFRLDSTAVQTYSAIAFVGIAVALLGRNGAIGIFFAALLFAALRTGTSARNLDPEVFRPELAGNLTQLIQGLVVLLVGADLIILYLWRKRRLGRGTGARVESAPVEGAAA